MKKSKEPKDPYVFDKETYWDRRQKGYAGQVPAYGSKQQRRESRIMRRRMQEDYLKQIQKEDEQYPNNLAGEG